jgi:hypothetical protein
LGILFSREQLSLIGMAYLMYWRKAPPQKDELGRGLHARRIQRDDDEPDLDAPGNSLVGHGSAPLASVLRSWVSKWGQAPLSS